MHTVRLILLAPLLGLLPVLGDTGVRDFATPVQDKKPDPESAKSCGACHKKIYEEWRTPGQMHAEAWTVKLYQAKLKKKKLKRARRCYNCHIPERTLARLGKRGVPGLKIRAFHFHVRQLDAQGKELAKHKAMIDSSNTLSAPEVRAFPFPLADGAKKIEVRVEHHFNNKLVADIKKQTIDLQ